MTSHFWLEGKKKIKSNGESKRVLMQKKKKGKRNTSFPTGGRRVSRPKGNFFPRQLSNSPPQKKTPNLASVTENFFLFQLQLENALILAAGCKKFLSRCKKGCVRRSCCRTQHCSNRIVRSPVTGYRVGAPSRNRIDRSSVNGGTSCRTGLNSDSRDVRSPGNSYWMMKRPPVWRTYARNRICTYRTHVDNYASSTKLIWKIGIFQFYKKITISISFQIYSC